MPNRNRLRWYLSIAGKPVLRSPLHISLPLSVRKSPWTSSRRRMSMDRLRTTRPSFHLFQQHVARVFASAFFRGPDEGAIGEGGDRYGNRSSHGVLRKFAYLLSAHWVREGLAALFMISLARHNTTTYGEFMLALSVGQIASLRGRIRVEPAPGASFGAQRE